MNAPGTVLSPTCNHKYFGDPTTTGPNRDNHPRNNNLSDPHRLKSRPTCMRPTTCATNLCMTPTTCATDLHAPAFTCNRLGCASNNLHDRLNLIKGIRYTNLLKFVMNTPGTVLSATCNHSTTTGLNRDNHPRNNIQSYRTTAWVTPSPYRSTDLHVSNLCATNLCMTDWTSTDWTSADWTPTDWTSNDWTSTDWT